MGASQPGSTAVSLTDCIALLAARQRCVGAELNGFPRPIAACDVEFAALLQEQAALSAALAALEPVARAETPIQHPRGDHLVRT
jgi:hypothetical protein